MSDRTGALQHSNVFVKHLPNDVASEGAVRELFQPYGPIECVRLVVRPAQLNLMRSFAFVKFSNLEDAAKAIAALDGTELQGSVLEVKTADADAGDRKPVSPIAAAGIVPVSCGQQTHTLLHSIWNHQCDCPAQTVHSQQHLSLPTESMLVKGRGMHASLAGWVAAAKCAPPNLLLHVPFA